MLMFLLACFSYSTDPPCDGTKKAFSEDCPTYALLANPNDSWVKTNRCRTNNTTGEVECTPALNGSYEEGRDFYLWTTCFDEEPTTIPDDRHYDWTYSWLEGGICNGNDHTGL